MARNDPHLELRRFWPCRGTDTLKSHETGHDGVFNVEVGNTSIRVQVFTHDGSAYQAGPFTKLETAIGQAVIDCRLPRCYARNWLSRLAGNFAQQVYDRCKADSSRQS